MIIVASFRANGKQGSTARRSFFRTPKLADFLARMIPLHCSRKLDSLGRIVIPKQLRKEYNFDEFREYEFYLHEEQGKRFLCIECPGAIVQNDSDL